MSVGGEIWSWMPRAGLGGLQRLTMGIHAELRRQDEDARMWFTGGDPTRLIAEVAPQVGGIERGSRWALFRAVLRCRPAVIIHHTGDTHRWVPLLRLLAPGTRHVRLVHQGFGRKRDLLHRLVFAGTAACIFPTQASLERSRACFPIAEERRHRLPYGVHVPAVLPEPAAYGLPLRLAILSRIDDGKGQLEFVELLARACRARPDLARTIRLDIWGGHDAADPATVAYLARLQQAAAATELAGCVRLCGHTADPAAVLRSSHWLVFPSLDEFYGLALMEAYAHGIPALCARRGSFIELNDQARGRFIDLAEPDVAVAQIASLPEMPADEHAALGRAGRQHALAIAGLDRCVEALRRILAGAVRG